MGIGIDIQVDSNQVKTAKKEVTDLNTAVDTTGKGISIPVDTSGIKTARKDILNVKDTLAEMEKHTNLNLDMEGTNEIQEALFNMVETLRQMQGLAGQGSRQGGKLDVSQKKEAARLDEKQKQNADAYEKALSRIGGGLDALYAKKKKLESVPISKPEEWTRAQEEIKGIDEELKGKTAGYEKLQGRFDPRYDKLTVRSNKVGQDLAGYGTMPEELSPNAKVQGAGVMKWMGKMAGYGAGLLGGFSLMSFLSQSLSQASSYGGGAADLKMLGAKDNRNNAALFGYSPTESLSIQDSIISKTGFTGDRLNDSAYAAMFYGRKMGIGGESVANYMGGTYAATGSTPNGYDTQLKYLRDTAVALGARGRIEEVLHANQQIMTGMVQKRGGQELTETEKMGMMAMQMGLWSGPGQIGKGGSGANILSSIDQSIRGGGNSPGQKILLAQALGVNNVKSLDDLWAYEKRMSAGGTPKNIKAVMDYSEKIGKQMSLSGKDRRQFAMRNVRDVFGLNENQTEAIFNPSFRKTLDSEPEKALLAMQKTKKGRKLLKEANIDPMSLEGNKHRRTIAQLDNAEVDVGKKFMPYVDDFKDSITKVVKDIQKGNFKDALVDAFKDNPIGQLMLLGAGLSVGSKLLPNVALPVPMPGGKGGIPLPVPPPPPGSGTSLMPKVAGVGAFITASAPGQAGMAGEGAVIETINAHRSPTEIAHVAKANIGELDQEKGGLIGAVRDLISTMREFNSWMREQQGHTIQQQLPNAPQRFRNK